MVPCAHLGVEHDLWGSVPTRGHVLGQEACVVVLGVGYPRQAKVTDLCVYGGGKRGLEVKYHISRTAKEHASMQTKLQPIPWKGFNARDVCDYTGGYQALIWAVST